MYCLTSDSARIALVIIVQYTLYYVCNNDKLQIEILAWVCDASHFQLIMVGRT